MYLHIYIYICMQVSVICELLSACCQAPVPILLFFFVAVACCGLCILLLLCCSVIVVVFVVSLLCRYCCFSCCYAVLLVLLFLLSSLLLLLHLDTEKKLLQRIPRYLSKLGFKFFFSFFQQFINLAVRKSEQSNSMTNKQFPRNLRLL